MVVECDCGYREKVESPEGGLSLVGTAAGISARHGRTCSDSCEVKFPGVRDISKRKAGFRSGRRY